MDWLLYVIIIIAVAALLYYIFKHNKDLLPKAALYAVSKAEEAWGSNTGRIKFAEVYTYLIQKFPLLTLFVSEEQINIVIESALEDMKKILETKTSLEK